MPRLDKYINSAYYSALNALGGRRTYRKVLVYVESYDDVFFWRSILSQVESADIRFEVTLPTRDRKLERGKKAALMSALQDSVGPYMIACVDADYDYLRQGASRLSEVILSNPYIFHTYAYSIENLQCWAPSLHDVCVMVTLNDSLNTIDFERFMESYSQVIYPLFVWSVLCSRDARYGKFDIADFMNTIKTGSVSKHTINGTLARVGQKVAVRLHRFESGANDATLAAYDALDAELQQLGVLPEETYLYVQGHQLFDTIVVPMLTSVCNSLKVQREREIQSQSKHNTQRRNEISCYERSVENVRSMLKKNTGYLRSSQVARITADLRQYLANITTSCQTQVTK